jgi:hypothetical protein
MEKGNTFKTPLHTAEVIGSKPISPTITLRARLRVIGCKVKVHITYHISSKRSEAKFTRPPLTFNGLWLLDMV